MIIVGERHKLTLELFPFISLFLCVIGVLAFLQNLLVMGEAGEAEKEARQPQIYQTAYRIVSFPDRLILHPPETSLDGLIESVTIDEQFGLQSIQDRRSEIQEKEGLELSVIPDFDEEQLFASLYAVATINQLAQVSSVNYEEYLLFDIQPGGADLFHFVRKVLDAPEFAHIRYGLTTQFQPGGGINES